jgi:hypothetical protein
MTIRKKCNDKDVIAYGHRTAGFIASRPRGRRASSLATHTPGTLVPASASASHSNSTLQTRPLLRPPPATNRLPPVTISRRTHSRRPPRRCHSVLSPHCQLLIILSLLVVLITPQRVRCEERQRLVLNGIPRASSNSADRTQSRRADCTLRVQSQCRR